jgi:hypothetical protein
VDPSSSIVRLRVCMEGNIDQLLSDSSRLQNQLNRHTDACLSHPTNQNKQSKRGAKAQRGAAPFLNREWIFHFNALATNVIDATCAGQIKNGSIAAIPLLQIRGIGTSLDWRLAPASHEHGQAVKCGHGRMALACAKRERNAGSRINNWINQWSGGNGGHFE